MDGTSGVALRKVGANSRDWLRKKYKHNQACQAWRTNWRAASGSTLQVSGLPRVRPQPRTW